MQSHFGLRNEHFGFLRGSRNVRCGEGNGAEVMDFIDH